MARTLSASRESCKRELRELLKTIDISVKDPQEPQQQVVFLTNLILCLKKGGLQASVADEWSTNCARRFVLPLVDIIKPCVILVLGQKTTEAILRAYRIPFSRPKRFSDMLDRSPYHLPGGRVLFALYHCGNRGVNCNRSMEEQISDWQRVDAWLRQNKH